ncbi:hypothetical protein [Alicyclobacillus ferrooxydans]|uniref:Uncharacterized protein n=1 Tax=Alicyclobacillus ferrooxydans TaxID=471514 RepID=A0A0P9GR30_9BACL|nr:hypothetical protein [Alicyclobacillus ferrooxydans]KPV43359.1 hypothetical protein AN477_13010 [Alicyclobacillus ferrooxydans]
MPCPGVTTGRVEVPGEDYGRIQQAVDSGKNLWRLSPVRTAQVIGTRNFGLRERDSYTFVEQYYDPGSGLQHAVVRVRHQSCTYLVELYQPIKQGQKGIWVVTEITEV